MQHLLKRREIRIFSSIEYILLPAAMTYKLLLVLFVTPFFIFSQQEIQITGRVTDGIRPIENVNVFVKNAAVGTTTNSDGYYELIAFDSDKLIYSFQGKVNQVFKVSDIEKTHNVVLLPEINALDGVTIERNKYRVRSQKALFDAYNIEQDIIKNKFQLLDKKISGYALDVREGDQINLASGNILASLQSMFAGVKISPEGSPNLATSPDDPNGVIYMRGNNSLQHPAAAVYDIDGMVHTETPLFLDLNNIQRIARLPGLGAVTVYGTLGKGGVFIINTKTANTSPTKEHLAFIAKKNAKQVYEVKTISHLQEKGNWPTYLSELYGTDDFAEAEAIFFKHKKVYQNSSYFVLDAVNYFLDKHLQKKFHNQIITDSKVLDKNDIELSRGLGLLLENYGDLEGSRIVYLNILKNWPHSPQAYLDLWQVFVKTNEESKAMRILDRYNGLIDKKYLTAEVGGSEDIFVSEYDELVKTTISETEEKSNVNKEVGGTRITLEWNDDQAGLLFHFVDPSKNFFVWDNSIEDEEVLHTNFPQVATTKEYFLPKNAENGTWRVNVNYLGNGRLKPTYLRATIQYNYGLITEQMETKLYRLSVKGKVQELFKLRQRSLLVKAN